jgi:hypothetical protein
MTKKGPLSKAEAFYIEHHYKTQDLDSLCKELDRAKSLVATCIEQCKQKAIDGEAFNVANQFFSKRGSTVMTENASVMSDQVRKNVTSKVSNCTTKIK